MAVYPVLPLRDIVVFPGMIVPLFVGREKSVKALEQVVGKESKILLLSQKEAGEDDPNPDNLFEVGTLATVLQLLRLPDGTVKVLVEGSARAKVTRFVTNEDFVEVEAAQLEDEMKDPSEAEAMARTAKSHFDQYIKLNKKIPSEILGTVNQIDNPSRLADTLASHLAIKIAQKQELLEIIGIAERLEKIYSLMESEISVLNTEKRIRSRVKRQMEKTQREYYLNEQMKAIQKELGDADGEGKGEIAELQEKLEKLKLSEEAKDKCFSELKKLKNMSPMSAEASVIRNYLEWMLDIPWKKNSRVLRDINKAEAVLDADHFGLEKVKERIVEYLAVQARMKQIKGPVLCLVGPPGVGKTSLARSIAKATGRNFVKISLGGVRDEAEIRGHRRTYIGSMPGKIIQSMKKAKTSNPLFLLDEIDKMGNDFRGDPAAALLEVLDPEQNANFGDHYLEVDYDLSSVMFFATSNSMNMPRPLLDRMEIIHLSGYTEDEKVGIATQHLITKQIKAHGLKTKEWSINEEALREVIRYYTREAGVRGLERMLAKLARKAVKQILQGQCESVAVTSKNLKEYAGIKKYSYGEAEKENLVGMTTGLAYTEVGGDLLIIESVAVGGKGKVSITGKLGDVMQESAQAALSYVRSRAIEFGIDPRHMQRKDMHIHVPDGATPKDGPSAGIAMTTTIVSVFTGIPVDRTVAMTGEVTLRGRVMPIGGLKEKLLAALRGGIKTVLIPIDNEKDLEEIPENVKEGLKIIPVSTVDEVLKIALTEPLKPIEWTEAMEQDFMKMPDDSGDGSVVKH
ncbi:MAG: endopeptidase La [Rickettsiales bacterium]|nr:endopeptidase La [Rickettsiales bacterium]